MINIPETKDIIGYIITGVGVVFTGVFSALVWWATRKSSEAAQASFKLAEQLAQMQLGKELAIRAQYRKSITEKMKKLYRYLDG